MNKFMKKLMKKDGFTLVELIVVIAILAILAGVAIPAYSGYITKAQDAAVITELDAIATAAQAANASAGEIEKIEVTTVTDASNADDKDTQIKVYFKKTSTSPVDYNNADKFDNDFKLYYAGSDAVVDKTKVSSDGYVIITIEDVILDGSYAEDPDTTTTNLLNAGATWSATKVAANTKAAELKAGWNIGVDTDGVFAE